MNCEEMMHIPELKDVLRLKAGAEGLKRQVRWIYFADCLQCIRSEYKIEDYIHGGEFVILTNRSVTDDNQKLIQLLARMYEYGIAALGINEGQISTELEEYCEEKQLALFELPEKYPLIDLSQIMCRRLVLEENERNAGEQLFSSILDAEHLSREHVLEQARNLDISLDVDFCVAEISFEYFKKDSTQKKQTATGQNIRHIIESEFSLVRKEKLLVLPQAGSVLVLIPAVNFPEAQVRKVLEQIAGRMQKEYDMNVMIGVGNRTSYLDEIKRSRDEASMAIRTAASVNMRGTVFFYREQGIYTLITRVDDSRVLDMYVEEQLGRLSRADEINDGNLLETLENYLNCSCNAKKTAEVMFVHRNTLNYRLKKICEILSCDLDDLDKVLALKLAFLIRKYRKESSDKNARLL